MIDERVRRLPAQNAHTLLVEPLQLADLRLGGRARTVRVEVVRLGLVEAGQAIESRLQQRLGGTGDLRATSDGPNQFWLIGIEGARGSKHEAQSPDSLDELQVGLDRPLHRQQFVEGRIEDCGRKADRARLCGAAALQAEEGLCVPHSLFVDVEASFARDPLEPALERRLRAEHLSTDEALVGLGYRSTKLATKVELFVGAGVVREGLEDAVREVREVQVELGAGTRPVSEGQVDGDDQELLDGRNDLAPLASGTEEREEMLGLETDLLHGNVHPQMLGVTYLTHRKRRGFFGKCQPFLNRCCAVSKSLCPEGRSVRREKKNILGCHTGNGRSAGGDRRNAK